MPEDLYDTEGARPAPREEEARGDQEDRAEEATALLPKQFFAGHEPEVGDRCEVEVTAVHEEEVSVKYVTEHEGEEEAEAKGKQPAMAGGPPGSMQSYLE